jgi:thiosulfate/3-mercaptopyruvate sulfurtransferase
MAFSTLIEPAQLLPHLQDEDWVVLDCRFDLDDPGKGRRDHQARHIPGARYAHLDEDLSGPIVPGSGRHPLPDAAAFMAWLGRQGVSNDSQVVVYDEDSGAFASRLWWMLRHWLGHRACGVLHGGWAAWREAGLAVSDTVPQPVPGQFVATPRAQAWIDTESLAAAVEADQVRLLDARMPPRFRGELEPIDPVAGHVPGAVNLPFPVNLVDGRFDAPDSLRARYQAALEGKAAEQAVCMCGSGVTACHDLLAMELAGLPGARLYVGSWSAWCSDPARPVATGD